MAQLKIDVIVDDKGNLVLKGVKGHVNKINSSLKSWASTANLVKVAMAGMIGVVSVRQVMRLAESFTDAASTTEGYRVRLEALLGSTSEATRLFDEMVEYAGRVPFTYDKIMASATALSGVLRGGVDQITEWMPMIADIAAVSKLTIDQTTQQIIRMYSAGAGSADLFRERGVLAMMDFKAGVSYSVDETVKKMSEAWEKPESKFRGAADRLGKTWAGLTSMLSDRWFQFRNTVMDAGVFDIMKKSLGEFIKKIDEFEKSGDLEKWAKASAVVVIKSFDIMTEAAAIFFRSVTRATEGWIKFAAAIQAVTVKAELESVNEAIAEIERKITEESDAQYGFGHYERLRAELGDALAEKEKLTSSLLDAFDFGAYGDAIGEMGKKTSEVLSGLIDKATLLRLGIAKVGDDGPKKIGALTNSISDATVETALLSSEIKDLNKAWDDTFSTIHDSFVNLIVDMTSNGLDSFEDFFDSIKKLALTTFSEAFTKQAFTPLISGMTSLLQGGYTPDMNMINPMTGMPAMTYSPGLSQYAPALGAGMMGYGMGGVGGGIGAAGGMLVGGPAGAMVGGYVGSMIQDMFEGDPPKPKIDLLYEIVDGELEKIGESWEGTGRDAELVDSVTTFFNKQIEFYKGLEIITGKKMSDLSFSIEGIGSSVLSQIESSLSASSFQFAVLNYDMLLKTFGQEFQTSFESIYNKLVPPNLLSSHGAPLFEEMSSAEDKKAIMDRIFASFLSYAKNTFHGDVKLTGKELFDLSIDEVDASDWKNFIQGFADEWGEIWNDFSQGLGSAFLAIFETGTFQDFEQQFKRSIYESAAQGLTEAFMSDAMSIMMGQTGIFESMHGANALLGDYIAGKEGVSLQDVTGAYSSGFEQINEATNQLRPVFETMQEGLMGLAAALGLNTDATILNTDAILGPIESLMRELQVGSLAPVQSMEGMQAEYEKLLAEAMVDPAKISTFASFAREYLDFGKSYGGYGGIAGGVSEVLQALLDTYRTPPASVAPVASGPTITGDPNAGRAGVDPRWNDPNFRAAQESRGMTISGTLTIDKSGLATIIGEVIADDPNVQNEIREIANS